MPPAIPGAVRAPIAAHLQLSSRLGNRPVGLGSVFSTILLAETVVARVPSGAAVVVDVGGGEAPYAPAAGADLHVAIDWRSPELTQATHQVVGDASRLPIGSRRADLVLCTEVAEHVADDRALYAELRRVVRDDGVLVLSAPFVHALHESPTTTGDRPPPAWCTG
ncbi:MAG: methyltransferase domain-containing protein [Acidimicrobiales bacterium]